MELQFLFDEAILSVNELNPGYDDHASDVWLVRTEREEVVVRSSKMRDEPSNDFWWGCKALFGIDPRNVHQLEAINNTLQPISSIPIPRVIQNGERERQFVVVEKLEGTVVRSFINQPASLIQSLGEGLARIHQCTTAYVGNPSGTFRIEQSDFHVHLFETMGVLISKFYTDDPGISKMFETVAQNLKELPVPDTSTFVLVDMDPSQFLTDGKVITGLVDTEAYVMAPRELDFIALEYLLTENELPPFKLGYERVMPIPEISEYRAPYRFLYRLLAVQGHVNIHIWENRPSLFR